jgi:hypothetical protein
VNGAVARANGQHQRVVPVRSSHRTNENNCSVRLALHLGLAAVAPPYGFMASSTRRWPRLSLLEKLLQAANNSRERSVHAVRLRCVGRRPRALPRVGARAEVQGANGAALVAQRTFSPAARPASATPPWSSWSPPPAPRPSSSLQPCRTRLRIQIRVAPTPSKPREPAANYLRDARNPGHRETHRRSAAQEIGRKVRIYSHKS